MHPPEFRLVPDCLSLNTINTMFLQHCSLEAKMTRAGILRFNSDAESWLPTDSVQLLDAFLHILDFRWPEPPILRASS